MNINLQEILCCHDWAIEPIAGQQLYNALMTAIANHRDGTDSEGMKKTEGFFLSKQKSEECGKLYVGDIHRIENRLYWRDEELAEDDQIINCVVIEGAVTRNGGACTYGSKDHREQIMYANTIPQVVGHIFLVDTPGGMVSAAPDYTQAIENCRMMKKPTVSFIDGICYSMGEWITCQTDYVIAMNPENGFGCIGAMSCGELAPHGSINSVTQERTFILVGKASPDKNREALEAANGNDELMQETADNNTERFHKVVRANRPAVTDDLLTGKCYTASEVMGKLVDEIGDFNRAIECVFQLADGTLKPAREMEVVNTEGTEETETTEPEKEPENADSINPKNDNAMTEEEMKAQEAVAAEAPQNTEGTSPTPDPSPEGEGSESPTTDEAPESTEAPAAEEEGTEEAPATEEAPESTEGTEQTEGTEEAPASDGSPVGPENNNEGAPATEEPAAEAVVEAKDKEIASLKESLATLQGIADERDAAVKERDDISASLEKAGLDYAEQHNALVAAEAKIAEHVATIEKLTKQVAELKAEVKELSEKPTPMITAESGIPTDNATGEAPNIGGVKSEVTSDMSVDEIRAKLRAKDEKAKTYRHK